MLSTLILEQMIFTKYFCLKLCFVPEGWGLHSRWHCLIPQNDTESNFNCLQCCLHYCPSVVNTTHLLLWANAKDLDQTRIWSVVSLTLNHFLSFSYPGGGVTLDSGAVGSLRLAELLKMSTQTEGSGFEVDRRRPRRSVFLHSGVRICPQESINEVLASHQAYYQLRGTWFNNHHLDLIQLQRHLCLLPAQCNSCLLQPLSTKLLPCLRAYQQYFVIIQTVVLIFFYFLGFSRLSWLPTAVINLLSLGWHLRF